MPLEFKQKGAVWARTSHPDTGEHELIEDLRVQKVRIGLARFGPIASVLRIARDRDLLPHFKTHFKVFGNLIQILADWLGVGGR